MKRRQQTLARAVQYAGIGLHSGAPAEVTLQPAPPDSGIVFADRHGNSVPADWRFVRSTQRAVTLGCGDFEVATVEHLLAALSACGVDNCRIYCSEREIPDPDGCAAVWVGLLREAGFREQQVLRREIRPGREGCLLSGGSGIHYFPQMEDRLICAVDFDRPGAGLETAVFVPEEDDFLTGPGCARTVAFWDELRHLWRQGLGLGGTFRGTLVYGEAGVVAGTAPLPGEIARHKLLDLYGDLVLCGAPVRGTVVAWKSGHTLHAAFAEALMQDRLAPPQPERMPDFLREIAGI